MVPPRRRSEDGRGGVGGVRRDAFVQCLAVARAEQLAQRAQQHVPNLGIGLTQHLCRNVPEKLSAPRKGAVMLHDDHHWGLHVAEQSDTHSITEPMPLIQLDQFKGSAPCFGGVIFVTSISVA